MKKLERDPTAMAREAISRLRGVRYEQGYIGAGHTTQAALANILGISVATIRNWEQGRSKPNGSALVLLRLLTGDSGAAIAAKLKYAAGRWQRTLHALADDSLQAMPPKSRWAGPASVVEYEDEEADTDD